MRDHLFSTHTRDHPLSTYAKFPEKLTFLTPWYAHVCKDVVTASCVHRVYVQQIKITVIDIQPIKMKQNRTNEKEKMKIARCHLKGFCEIFVLNILTNFQE